MLIFLYDEIQQQICETTDLHKRGCTFIGIRTICCVYKTVSMTRRVTHTWMQPGRRVNDVERSDRSHCIHTYIHTYMHTYGTSKNVLVFTSMRRYVYMHMLCCEVGCLDSETTLNFLQLACNPKP